MTQKYPITKSSCVLDVVDPTDPDQKTKKLDVVLNNIKNQGTENKTLPEQAGDKNVKSIVEVGGVPKGFVFEDTEDLEWTASRVLLQMLFPDTAPYISNKYGFNSNVETYNTYVGQSGYNNSNSLNTLAPQPTNVVVSCLNQLDVEVPFTLPLTTGAAPQNNSSDQVGEHVITFSYNLNTTGITLKSSYGDDTNLKVAYPAAKTVLWDESSEKVKAIDEVVGTLKFTRKVRIIQPKILVKYKNTSNQIKWATCDDVPSVDFDISDCCDLGSQNDKFYIELYALNENVFNQIQVKSENTGFIANLNEITFERTTQISLASGGYKNNPVWDEVISGGTSYRCYKVKYDSPVIIAGRTIKICKK